jgi:hypothetical protein
MIRTIARRIAIALLIPIGLYLTAAGVLSHIPANANWREPDAGIMIFVQTNGVHTGIVLPDGPGRWRAFGWGDRDFYINTPTWADVQVLTVLKALVGGGHTLLHVDRLRDFRADTNWRPLRVRHQEYQRIVDFITATLEPGGQRIPGYGPDDDFYPARGGYSALRTCNVWVGEALKSAGVRTAMWSPFEDGIMRWVRMP